MKVIMKLMLVWVVSFSLAFPVGAVRAGDIDPDKINVDIRAKHEAEKETRAKAKEREIVKKAIIDLKTELESKLDGLRGKSPLNPFNDVRDDYMQALEKVSKADASNSDYVMFNNAAKELMRAGKEITSLADRLKKKCELYSSKGGTDYEWSDLQATLELNEDNTPKVNDRSGHVILFSRAKWDGEVLEEEEKAKAREEAKDKKEKASVEREDSGRDSWGSVFHDSRDRKKSRTKKRASERTEFTGCKIPEHENQPSSGERAFGLGALTLFGIGASALAGINASHLYKEKKSLRHQIERASANGDSPFFYRDAYAALNYQNPLGGLGETLGPISMAISSILMPGNRGYLSQQEYLRSQRLRAIIDAMAQARATASTSGSTSRTVTFEKQLQSIESGLGGILSQLNNGAGGLNDTIRNLAEQTRNEQIAMNRTAQLLSNAGRVFNARAATLSGISELADRLQKGTQEFNEAVRNGDQSLRDGGNDKVSVQFKDNFDFNRSSNSNRSGVSTGPNGFPGAPGFPQTGGGGIDARFRFGPRPAAFSP